LEKYEKFLSNMEIIDMELGYNKNVVKLIPKIIMVKQKPHMSSIQGKNINYDNRYIETQKYIEKSLINF
jgi:hypothetical protein